MQDMDERRLSFGSVAEDYDAHRPSYPSALVDEILAFSGLVAGGRALESGAGTGIATALFAGRGLRITAVEPSAEMAGIARRRLQGSDVQFLICGLEQATIEQPYSLLYSAQAWHWVDPTIRYQLAADALLGGGAIALFWNYPDWESCALQAQLDQVYAAYPGLHQGPGYPGTSAAADPDTGWPGESVELFTDHEVRHYDWQQTYSSEQYTSLLGTHSDHILLDPDSRRRLLAGVAGVIDAHGGSFELPYRTLLLLARKR
jgi:SAM-dependent methyltransferase